MSRYCEWEARWLNGTEMDIRYACEADELILFNWRNDPETRRMSLNTTPLSWNEHSAWLRSQLLRTDRCLMICELPSTTIPVGLVRFEASKCSAVISLNISPIHRGKGFSTRCLTAAIEHYFAIRPWVTAFYATIKRENSASLSAFKKAGFRFVKANGKLLLYQLNMIELPRE